MAAGAKRGLSYGQKWLVSLLFIVPLLIVIGKWPALPTSGLLTQWFSLDALPAAVHHGARHILFVPLGAVLVVFCRLTLGIRVLGPFRSILLAVAFQVTGILVGLIFLAVIQALIYHAMCKRKEDEFARLEASKSVDAETTAPRS
jgi:hypothetical protein